MTTPSNWTSTQADAFRDRRKFISPHAGQPMYHMKGVYDKSHYAEPGAQTGTANAAQVAYAPFEKSAACFGAHSAPHAMYAGGSQGGINGPYASNGPSYYGASSSNGNFASTSTTTNGIRAVSSSSQAFPSDQQQFGYYFPKAVPGGKDLFNTNLHPTKPLTGVYSDTTLAYDATAGAHLAGASSNGIMGGNNNGSSYGPSNGHLGSLSGDAPRNKYHIPGYSGFVRGEQFAFGNTYGKTTRMALDVPTDIPLEP